MTAKKILSLVLAVVIGYFVVKFVLGLMGMIFGLLGWLITAALVAGVAYVLYRGFNNMLSSGKRLTS